MKLIFILLLLQTHSLHAQSVEQIKEGIKKVYADACKELNAQLPIKVDEVTTLRSVIFLNWTCTSTYTVSLGFSDWGQEEIEEMLSDTKENGKERVKAMILRGKYNMPQSQFRQFMKTTGIKWRMNYYDENYNFIGTIIYDYKDF